MYEIVCGYPPYYSKDKDRMTRGIWQGALEFPAHLSENFKHLVTILIDKNPRKRP